jgi:hypothetical protein
MASKPKASASPPIATLVANDAVYRLIRLSSMIVGIPMAMLAGIPRVLAAPQYSSGERQSPYNLTAPDETTSAELLSEGSGLSKV